MTTEHDGSLPSLPEPTSSAYRRAQRTLKGAFDDVRVRYTHIDAPIGPVFLARSSRGLVRTSFRLDEDGFLDELERLRFLAEPAHGDLDRERRQLEDYFDGKLREFGMPVDIAALTPFQQRVLEATLAIPFGRVETYGDIARTIEKPGASRAVGNALGANPVPIVIPCHRVIASGGRIGGFSGGLPIKRELMKVEGIRLGVDELTFE